MRASEICAAAARNERIAIRGGREGGVRVSTEHESFCGWGRLKLETLQKDKQEGRKDRKTVGFGCKKKNHPKLVTDGPPGGAEVIKG